MQFFCKDKLLLSAHDTPSHYSHCRKTWINANLLGANVVQKSANQREIRSKDGKFCICLPVIASYAVFTIFARYLTLACTFCSKFALSKFDVNQTFRAVSPFQEALVPLLQSLYVCQPTPRPKFVASIGYRTFLPKKFGYTACSLNNISVKSTQMFLKKFLLTPH